MKLIWVNGTFDVMHVGHVRLLEFAKSLGDFLIVGLDTDDRIKELKGQDRPVNSLASRIEFMRSIKWVDEVVNFDSDAVLSALVKSVRPFAMVVGEEYKNKKVIGSEWANEVIYFNRVGDYSTTKIINKK
jgi:D-beta-D-heptose 7-phosphate kinase/D-beta-D-heptose 1-phosphate adenosyltransferase